MKKIFVCVFVGTPILLIFLIFFAHAHKGPTDVEKLEMYRTQVSSIDKQWAGFSSVSSADESFSNQIKALVVGSKQGFSLSNEQETSLGIGLLNLFHAYSLGSYDDYKAFRMPSNVPFSWTTNKLGSVDAALREGKTIALPKAVKRWHELSNKHITWDNSTTDEDFLAYIKLYAGDTLFSNYFEGVAFDQSRIVFANYSNTPIPQPWNVEFSHTNIPINQNSYATAPTKFLNMGYMSQKRYSFIKFEDSLEETKAHFGTIAIADCFLFVKRRDADGNLPIIVRFYWDPKFMTWLPDDLVVCNMEQKGNFWPIF